MKRGLFSETETRNDELKKCPTIRACISDREIVSWFLFGVILRLLLMPIAAHWDLISNFKMGHDIIEHQIYQIGFPVAYFYAFLILIYRPLFPVNYFGRLDQPGIAAYWVDLLQPQVYQFLFLAKLPLLIFDLVVAFLLLRIIEDKSKATIAFKFWMVNPVGILATYLMGQVDIIPTALIVAGLYFFKNCKSIRSFFSLGVGALLKLYPLLFILPMAGFLSKGNSRMRIFFSICAAFVPFALFVPFVIVGGIPLQSAAPLFGRAFEDFLFAWRIAIHDFDILYPYMIVYILTVLYAFYEPNPSFEKLWRLILVILLAYYCMGFFHPQFFVWVTPFIALWLTNNPRTWKLFALQILCFFIYTFNFERAMAMGLFMPINPEFINWPSPIDFLTSITGTRRAASFIVSIFQNIFTAVSILIIARVIFPKVDFKRIAGEIFADR